jgi:uncharacterized protein YbgA (DUF1722 family)
LPVEEEGRLSDPALRENFLERVFSYCRWQACAESRSARHLVAFHTRHKFLLLAHSERHYRELGRLVAAGDKRSLRQTYEEYGRKLMEGLTVKTSAKKHANILEHLMGYFSDRLSAAERRELVALIGDFRARLVPLIAPVTLIHHYVKKYEIAYLADQIYLAPTPKELMLRNNI